MPGETAPLTGADLDEGPVVMRLEQAAGSAVVGEGVVAADGTLEATIDVPPGFPLGYATLAVQGDGEAWSTIVLIGPRAEGPQPDGAGEGTTPLNPQVIALVVLAVGIVIFAVAGLRYLRR